ncbi:hypothetical protein [Paradesulfitobacterium ferrireducens]|uniref:hypothetical protein n=1 Tax=Paradesulfitobacterium ferrireducens TaxID=2816476 RepID=UPI001A905A7D|nr:hypothetical protein [Paradesulfitobacterium ferrireducens]
MKIISVKKGFTSDHSSTSYEFLAVDKALGKKERQAVASLSSRANPTAREVSFIYHADGYDIPGGWEALMEKYYDVMYSESYDWWTLAMAFNCSQEQVSELMDYELDGGEDCGIEVLKRGGRAIVVINCRLDASYFNGPYADYDDYGYYQEDDEEDEETGGSFTSDDGLLNLLVQLREQLMQGDYRSLYAVWEKYGFVFEDDEENEDMPPIPPERPHGKKIIEQFSNLLEII